MKKPKILGSRNTSLIGERTDAAPPPNPAIDAGESWPARRKPLEKEWLKLLGPFPSAKPPLDLEVDSAKTVLASTDDPSYPIRAGDITRYKVRFRFEADADGGTLFVASSRYVLLGFSL